MDQPLSKLYLNCRFCLKGKEEVGTLKVIKSETAKLYYDITHTRLCTGDNNDQVLSQLTCVSCAANLVMFFQFKTRLITNQFQLREAIIREQEEAIAAEKKYQMEKISVRKPNLTVPQFISLSKFPNVRINIKSIINKNQFADVSKVFKKELAPKQSSVVQQEKDNNNNNATPPQEASPDEQERNNEIVLNLFRRNLQLKLGNINVNGNKFKGNIIRKRAG